MQNCPYQPQRCHPVEDMKSRKMTEHQHAQIGQNKKTKKIQVTLTWADVARKGLATDKAKTKSVTSKETNQQLNVE